MKHTSTSGILLLVFCAIFAGFAVAQDMRSAELNYNSQQVSSHTQTHTLCLKADTCLQKDHLASPAARQEDKNTQAHVVSIDTDGGGAYADESMIIWLVSRASYLLLHKLWD